MGCQLSTISAKYTPLAHKQSTPLLRAPFSSITNVMDFGDDGLYEVSILFVNSSVVQVVNVVLLIE